ncbi:response regulator transcription factor [Allopusillimonas ginsengisoli]|uniref:response regulator transcription factor n=1 Tax=Allopusillimonas ginsengisoli TaxID=453575 RepID=UPI0010210E50|nr:response regulator transcription factor [Allopusillimonas ginsengisoli]TEA79348.1 response regulator transcription factor [Allopusillimonas ginsengisoli]
MPAADSPGKGAAGARKSAGVERLLLVIEDDAALSRTMVRSFERRGYRVISASSVEGMRALLEEQTPGFAVVDLKLQGEASGLVCVQELHEHDPDMLIVVLTGFASIATAVEAIKLGACHYLAKPSNTDDIERAFQLTQGNTDVQLAKRQASIKTLEWERIHEMLVSTDFNISEAARRLGMHRRTLARKLGKQQVR